MALPCVERIQTAKVEPTTVKEVPPIKAFMQAPTGGGGAAGGGGDLQSVVSRSCSRRTRACSRSWSTCDSVGPKARLVHNDKENMEGAWHEGKPPREVCRRVAAGVQTKKDAEKMSEF